MSRRTPSRARMPDRPHRSGRRGRSTRGAFAPLLCALEVPRERFVRPSTWRELARHAALRRRGSGDDQRSHAYLLSFRVLDLSAGHRVAELGTGSGYGAALASHIVSPGGSVLTLEIDEALARRAESLLEGYPNVRVVRGDAGELLHAWGGFDRITVTFAVDEIPPAWLDAIPGRPPGGPAGENGQRSLSVRPRQASLSGPITERCATAETAAAKRA